MAAQGRHVIVKRRHSATDFSDDHNKVIDIERTDGAHHDLLSLVRSFSETNIGSEDGKKAMSVSSENNKPFEHIQPAAQVQAGPSLSADTSQPDKISVLRSDEKVHDLYQTLKLSSSESKIECANTQVTLRSNNICIRIVHMAGTCGFLKPAKHQSFLPFGHILVHSGDFTKMGKYEEFVLFDSWLESVSSKYANRIVVLGEKDMKTFGSANWDRYRAMLPHATHVLCCENVEVMGIQMYGLSFQGYHQKKSLFDAFRPGKDRQLSSISNHAILITNEPSYGYLDSQHLNGNTSLQHGGSRTITDIVKRFRPMLHLHGQAPDSRGVLFPSGGSNNILTVNSFMCDPESKVMYGSPHVIKCTPVTVHEANLRTYQFAMDDLYF